ncbi:NAD(P)/FAD-dependent oxidoreductase [Desulfoscipio sp. XC116]|uniref:NAD(P)/FAD-dependent oxidoreductase n=1 Tax=Desulfoscipio sp. XC116 TaxID=3144975 RepID=UPI00325B636F
MLRVTGVKLSLDEDKSLIKNKIAGKLGVGENEIARCVIFKESIDARKRNRIYFVYTVDVELVNEQAVFKRLKAGDVSVVPPLDYRFVQPGHKALPHRPVVLGTGPAGLFAGLLLARMGYRPLLLERGADVDTRTQIVRSFWQTGCLDKDCNVQFGEGGAGTFSDGKLTTLIKDKRCRKVLEEMVLAGAPGEIIYSYKPHIGTDILKIVVKNIRQKIIELGGEVRFNSKVTDIIVEGHKLTGLEINDRHTLATEALVLAIGHSARDTFAMLHNRGVLMSPKPFSIGVRVEHPQTLINQAQHKNFAGHPKLGPAEYKLAYHSSAGRSAYTFCMCPGGLVVAAASEDGYVVTNGMSEYARDGQNANSALLVGVRPDDFGSDHPLAGVEFQRKWEGRAFALGGGNYIAPVQLVGDFLADRPSAGPGEVEPSYPRGVRYADLRECLPGYVTAALKEAIMDFDRKLKGFALPGAVLTGVETRSSSPVRIYRDEKCRSNIAGIYPAGEGPGYAGGIVSSAVDGVKAAEFIVSQYARGDNCSPTCRVDA